MRITLSKAASEPIDSQPVVNNQIPTVASNVEDILEVGNLKIRGIKLESIESACIQLSVPLKHRCVDFPGLYDDARISIPKDCSAFILVTVGKGEDGKLQITQVDLSFSQPVVIENPSSAFREQPTGFWSRAVSGMEDLLAKVHVRGLTIDPRGEVHIDGKLIKGGLLHSSLDEEINQFLPAVNLGIRHLLTSIKPDAGDKQFGLKFVKALGQVLDDAYFKADIDLEPTSLSVQGEDIDFATEKRSAKAGVSGHLTLNEALDFSLTTNPSRSFVDSLLGRILISASVNVEHPLESSAHVAFKIDGHMDALPNVDINGHKISAKAAKFAAAGSADISDREKTVANGNVQFSCELQDPLLKSDDMAVELNGKTGVTLGVRDFKLLKTHEIPSFKATVSAYIHQNNATRREFDADFRVHKNGRLTMSALQHPSTMLELPFQEAYGQPTKQTNAENSTSRVSDLEFDHQMEKLTNSRITKGNRAQLLVDGCESLPQRLHLINEAKESIWLQTLIFQDDVSGMELAKALCAAAERGVKVHVIVDSQGSAIDLETVVTENQAYKTMIAAGVDLRLHNDNAVSALRDAIDVIVDNHLCSLSKAELVGGPITTFIAIACRTIMNLQKGQLAIPESQKQKFIESIRKGFGYEADDTKGMQNSFLPTDSTGVIQLGGLIDRMEGIFKQVYSWHEKHFIVDGKHAILGGINISDSYLFGGHLFKDKQGKISQGWRDTDVLIEGPAVEDASRAFSRNWRHLTGEELFVKPHVLEITPKDGVRVQIIQHSPSISGDNNITNFLTARLNRLQPGETAYFENAYFCPSGAQTSFFEAMTRAAKRGVQITVLTNDDRSSDVPSLNRAAFHTYDDLLKAGVRIFERSDNRTIHSKIAVLGKDVAIVGSANLDNRSARVNSEVIAVIYDEQFATRQRDVIKRDLDLRVCREITRQKVASICAADSVHFAVMALMRDLY